MTKDKSSSSGSSAGNSGKKSSFSSSSDFHKSKKPLTVFGSHQALEESQLVHTGQIWSQLEECLKTHIQSKEVTAAREVLDSTFSADEEVAAVPDIKDCVTESC